MSLLSSSADIQLAGWLVFRLANQWLLNGQSVRRPWRTAVAREEMT